MLPKLRTLSIAALIVLAVVVVAALILVGFKTSPDQSAVGIPGFPELSWGMSLKNFHEVTKSQPAFRQAEVKIDESTIVGGGFIGNFQTGENQLRDANFLFKALESGEFSLVAYVSGPIHFNRPNEMEEIESKLDKTFTRIEVAEKPGEFAHLAWMELGKKGGSECGSTWGTREVVRGCKSRIDLVLKPRDGALKSMDAMFTIAWSEYRLRN